MKMQRPLRFVKKSLKINILKLEIIVIIQLTMTTDGKIRGEKLHCDINREAA